MAEVQEVVIDCVALFYEEGQGGGGGIIERKTSLGVESTCKRNGWSSLEMLFLSLTVPIALLFIILSNSHEDANKETDFLTFKVI